MWAPAAARVELLIAAAPSGGAAPAVAEARRVPLTPEHATGWWFATEPDLIDPARRPSPDIRYAFLVDGEGPFPDPRSARLPEGVHGWSAPFSVDASSWTDEGWTGRDVRGAVIYELHVGTFTPQGTFDSAIARLDHLVELGVGLVEVMPVNAFNGTRGWGYDGVGWFAVHEPYGGPDGFVRFVDACHARGLGVVLDVVYNHLGPSGNHLARFGPYLSTGANTWGSTINLDGPDSDEVRAFVIDNALRWFDEFHVDALRLDAVHALVDHTAVHILEELATRTAELSARLGRPLSLIAESDLNDPRLLLPRSRGGLGLTASWDDDIHHAVHTAVSGERQGYYADFGSLASLAKVLTTGYFHDGTYSSFRRRRHGRPMPVTVLPASSLLAYTCTHDQVGNRARGDRPSNYLDDGRLAIKAALVLLSPFTPMLFMGEEWGARTPFQYFTSHPERELGEAVRTGRRAEFADHGWDAADIPDPQAPETFERSKLDWHEITEPRHAALLDLYRGLIRLRRSEPDIAAGGFDTVAVDVDEDAGWVAMHRGRWSVLCNLTDTETTVPISLTPPTVIWGDTSATPEGTALGPHSVVVARRR